MSYYRRGEIYYIESVWNSVGSEQRGTRPAVIVSNEKNNRFSSTVEVVFMTTQPKNDMPTHVTILSTGRPSTVLCEQINTVSIERIADYCGECSDEEMKKIDEALLISLELQNSAMDTLYSDNESNKPLEKEKKQLCEENDWQSMYIAADAQLSILKSMYNDLLKQVVNDRTTA